MVLAFIKWIRSVTREVERRRGRAGGMPWAGQGSGNSCRGVRVVFGQCSAVQGGSKTRGLTAERRDRRVDSGT